MFSTFPTKWHCIIICETCRNAVVLRVGSHKDDISAGECLKSRESTDRTAICFCQCECLLELLTVAILFPPCWSIFTRFQDLFFNLSFGFSHTCRHVFFLLQNRHTYAQFLLRWLQARAVCPTFIWSGDQVRVLLCQHGIRLWRALPALPTRELWYWNLNLFSSANVLYPIITDSSEGLWKHSLHSAFSNFYSNQSN